MSIKPSVVKWKDIGIEITLTEDGLYELAKIIADGCPRNIDLSRGHAKTRRIVCKAEFIERKTCFQCWYKWLLQHSTIKEEI